MRIGSHAFVNSPEAHVAAPFQLGQSNFVTALLRDGVPPSFAQFGRNGRAAAPNDGLGLTPWDLAVAHHVARLWRPGNRVKLREGQGGALADFPTVPVVAELASQRRLISQGRQSVEAERAPAQIAVLETCLALAAEIGGQPNVVQVVAALALRPGMGGLDGVPMRAALSHMVTRYRNEAGFFAAPRPWLGQPHPFSDALNWRKAPSGGRNLALKALEVLAAARGCLLTTRELAHELGIFNPVSQAGEHRLNSALQVLSLLRVVDKHPYHRDSTVRQPLLVWSWSGAAPIKRQLENPALAILERAYRGPFKLQEMYSIGSKATVDPQNFFAKDAVIGTAKQLSAAGLLSIASVNGAYDGKLALEVSLTELGRSLTFAWVGVPEGSALPPSYRTRLRPRLIQL
ncbi:MAG: hypothetical protein K1X79_05720 [Oligoflexia bacterium]|nr:hypothetical protein [Oligoflexia bacterium]